MKRISTYNKWMMYGVAYGLAIISLALPFIKLRPVEAEERKAEIVEQAETLAPEAEAEQETETAVEVKPLVELMKEGYRPCLADELYQQRIIEQQAEIEEVPYNTNNGDLTTVYSGDINYTATYVNGGIPLENGVIEHIRTLCGQYGVPFELMMAIAYVESGFNPTLISETDDWGLFQIAHRVQGETSARLGVWDYLNPYENALAGVDIFATHYYEQGGNIPLALMCYNNGAGAGTALWQAGIYETDYTRKVLEMYYYYLERGI